MALPNRNLDDKSFAQIVDDARAMIPRVAPDWTDHNIHDPGITFIELFAWLAEIQHYRTNRLAEHSVLRFLRLAGVDRAGQHPATARLAMTLDAELQTGVLVPAHWPVSPIGKEQVAFETLRDTFLTCSRLTAVVTSVGGREIDQTRANTDPAAQFAPFGPAPAQGDSVRLGFTRWFTEPEVHLHVDLYEQGLPPIVPLSAEAFGFVPSVTLRWQYRADGGWRALPTLEDATLQFSRSGHLRFATPGNAAAEDGMYWIRATVESGRYEVAPNVAEISVNALEIRQVARVVNEDLGVGLGTPDQVVRLAAPPLLAHASTGARFQVGDVLDWPTMVMRLGRPADLHPQEQADAVQRVADRLGVEAQAIVANPELIGRDHEQRRQPTVDERLVLARAFDALLEDEDLYDRRAMGGLRFPPQLRSVAEGNARGTASRQRRRRVNRAVIEAVFSDQVQSDRLEIQVGVAAQYPEQEPQTWATWERVLDFSASGRADPHYVLDQQTGEVQFGNGLNGRVPSTSERIRARMYVHASGATGNLPAGHAWRLVLPDEPLRSRHAGAPTTPAAARPAARGTNLLAASGGAGEESLDAAAMRARGTLRTRSRAVTTADYVDLASRTPGLRVAQVKVLPGFNPRLPCTEMRDHVTVVILPYAREDTVGPPAPSPGFLQTVRRQLQPARLVATVLHVVGPVFVPVAVSTRIVLAKGAQAIEVRRRIERALNAFLDPVRGGPAATGWPFGRAVFPSEIHALLMRDPGVAYVTEMSLNGGIAEAPLRLGTTALPFGGRHAISVVGFEERQQPTQSASRPVASRATGHA